MTFPMWIPYKQTAPEHNSFNEDLRQNWLEIERWSRNNVGPPSRQPFIIVAKDGSGDFTSISAAANSVPTNTPTVIYVKPGTYTEPGTVDLSDKQIAFLAFRAAGSNNTSFGVTWNYGGLTANSGTAVSFRSFALSNSNATGFMSSTAGTSVALYDSNLSSASNIVNAVNLYARSTPFFYGSASSPVNLNMTMDAKDCAITIANGTQQLTPQGTFVLNSCTVTGSGGNPSWRLNGSSGSGTVECVITDCSFQNIDTLRINTFNDVHVSNNNAIAALAFGPTFVRGIATLSITGNRTVNCTSNEFQGTNITTDGGRGIISGTYYSGNLDGSWELDVLMDNDSFGVVTTSPILTLVGNNFTGSVLMRGDNSNVSANGLSVTGNLCVLLVNSLNNITNTVNVSGNNNKFATQVGATNVNTGAGNVFL